MELSSSWGLKLKTTWNVALLPKGIYVESWRESNNNVFEFSGNSDFQQKSPATPKTMDGEHYLNSKYNLSSANVISLEIYLSLASNLLLIYSIFN